MKCIFLLNTPHRWLKGWWQKFPKLNDKEHPHQRFLQFLFKQVWFLNIINPFCMQLPILNQLFILNMSNYNYFWLVVSDLCDRKDRSVPSEILHLTVMGSLSPILLYFSCNCPWFYTKAWSVSRYVKCKVKMLSEIEPIFFFKTLVTNTKAKDEYICGRLKCLVYKI